MIRLAYKGKNGWYLLHPDYQYISSTFTVKFSTKKELEKYCKIKNIEFKIIDNI